MANFRDFCKKENYQMTSTGQTTQKLAKKVADVKQKVRRHMQVNESNDILAESENMIEALQDKIRQVFYRFGMAGLERLDEAIIDTCQQMLYPDGVPQKQTKGKVTTTPAAKPAAPAKPKTRAQTALEIAAAALHQMEPMQPIENAMNGNVSAPATQAEATPTGTESRRAFNPITDLPHNKPAQADYMAQFADMQLSEEELAIMQQGLAKEGL